MVFVYMEDPLTDRAAIFEENGTIGDPEDPNSIRNAPLNNPIQHLSKIRFHSDFDYYQVHSITTVTITHPSVAGVEVSVNSLPTLLRRGQSGNAMHALATHNLGYPPSYMIISDGCLIGQSSTIQLPATGSSRSVSPYATASIIGLFDVGYSTELALPAMSKAYRVVIFRRPTADSPFLRDIDVANDVLILGRGKWRGNLRQLRRTLLADASPFDVPMGRTTDIRGGASRTVLADGTTFSNPGYAGSFAGSPAIECTVE